jgi:phage terminase small subunit
MARSKKIVSDTGLTPQQEVFCQHYVLHQNASEAYRTAFPRSRQWKEAAVNVNASKLLADAKIQLRINALGERITKRAEEAFDITADRILQELAAIAFANIGDYVRIDAEGLPQTDFSKITRRQFAAIGEITQEDIETGQRTGRRVKFKLLDKKGALVDLGKHVGLFKDKSEVKHEHSWVGEAEDEIRQQLALIAERRRDTGSGQHGLN